ncbi:MAG TPA: hypothetical protein VE967_04965, partial [Gemmatimonadaceae bacterium]|nr:hypothetical protein [Gemmatimonadaceae bacterium]
MPSSLAVSHPPRWSQLRIGLLAAAALLAGAAAVFLFMRVGQLHGQTSTLVVLTDHANGIMSGSDVWLD